MARGSTSHDPGKRSASNVDIGERDAKKKKELMQQEQDRWVESMKGRWFKCEKQVERPDNGRQESVVTKVIRRRVLGPSQSS